MASAAPVQGAGDDIRVLFVSPETPPWVKSGGLGDVTAALPAALRTLGIDARVLAPAYAPVLAALGARAREIAVLDDLGGAFPSCRLLDAGEVHGAPLVLLDCPAYYARPGT